jgi:hypothetical protein
VLTEQEDEVITTWVQNMQKVGLTIIFQKLKLKVVEITQTILTPFWNGVP